MSTQEQTGFVTFNASEAIAQYLRVYNNSGEASIAGLADRCMGTAARKAAQDTPLAVDLWNRSGSRKVVAAGAIAAGALVYTAASGKVNDVAASTSFLLGTAKTAAGADGDIIEIVPTTNVDAVP